MTDTRDWADEKATTDVTRWFHDNGFPCDGNDLPALERLYADALRAAARVQPGHVRTDDGTERKVLGTLPVTADGCVAMPGAFVYAQWFNGGAAKGFVRHEAHGPEIVCFVEMSTTLPDGRSVGIRTFLSDCYSTRAAAEAARTAGEGE